MRAEIQNAVNANRAARLALKAILDLPGVPGPNTLNAAASRISMALSDNLDAIQEIERIMAGAITE
jgi:hypothetical protein